MIGPKRLISGINKESDESASVSEPQPSTSGFTGITPEETLQRRFHGLCACFFINALRDGVPGAPRHHAGKQAVQLPHAQLIAMTLDGLQVRIQDTEPELAVCEPEVICQVLQEETRSWQAANLLRDVMGVDAMGQHVGTVIHLPSLTELHGQDSLCGDIAWHFGGKLSEGRRAAADAVSFELGWGVSGVRVLHERRWCIQKPVGLRDTLQRLTSMPFMSTLECAFTKGCCTFTATSRPSFSVARCTWASDAAPSGLGSNSTNKSSG
ncbi:hypothetical protein E2C01_008383 [Portunus trituberculatus]|uniref:Uncharacterized protein n=1 Tax=Portunus trituberculatus TaxID=210409 RepID=A0A5B7D5D5_PORTR|nr:hypothetical protein [Portunus trituberculatus]